MLTKEQLQSIRANPRFLAAELQLRGVEVVIYDWANEVLCARYGSHEELLVDIDSSIVPYAASVLASSKPITKRRLAELGLSVPRGACFAAQSPAEAVCFAATLGFPVVVKPSNGTQGECVYQDLESPDEVAQALNAIERQRGNVQVMVEEQITGREHRIFITRDGLYAALLRDPAHVIGDGVSTIQELVSIQNATRIDPRPNCLCPIVLDEVVNTFLRRRGKTLASVPARNEKVYLRNSSNVSLGGFPIDITDIVHPSVIEICKKALSAVPGLPYAGVDFMCHDIRKAQSPGSYAILELNPLPGIGIHIAPGAGKSRNVAAMIADMIFPETKAALRRAA